MALTPTEINFLKALKANGYTKEQATEEIKNRRLKALDAQGLTPAKNDLIKKIAQAGLDKGTFSPEKTAQLQSLASADYIPMPKPADATTPKPEQMTNIYGETGSVPSTVSAYSPLEALKSGAETAVQGVKDIGGGLVEQAKQAVQSVSNPSVDNGPAGAGFNKAAEGVKELISAPFQVVAKTYPAGESILNAVSSVANAPADLAGWLWEKGAEMAGVDITSEDFKASKEQVKNAALVGTAIAAPKIGEKISEKTIIEPSLTDAAKAGEALGVDVPLQAQTSSGLIKTLADINKKGIFSDHLTQSLSNFATKMEEQANAIKAKYESSVGKTAASTNTAKGLSELKSDVALNIPSENLAAAGKNIESLKPSTPIDKFELGNAIKKGLDEAVASFDDVKKKLYDEASSKNSEAVQNSVIQPTSTTAAINELMSGSSRSIIQDAAGSFIKSLKEGLGKEGVPLEVLRQTVKDLGAKIKDVNDPISTGAGAKLKKIYAAMKEDLDKGYSSISPEYAEAIKQANAFFKNNIEKINSTYGRAIENLNPEQIYKRFVKPNNASEIMDVKDLVPSISDKLPVAVLTDLFDKATDSAGNFKPETFIKTLEKLDNKTKTAIFNQDQLARFDEVKKGFYDAKKILDEEKAKPIAEVKTTSSKDFKFTKGSQIADIEKLKKDVASATADTRFMKAFSLVRTALGVGIAYSSPVALLGTTLAYILGDAALSKFLKSDLLQNTIREGVKTPNIGGAIDLMKNNPNLFLGIAGASRAGQQQEQ